MISFQNHALCRWSDHRLAGGFDCSAALLVQTPQAWYNAPGIAADRIGGKAMLQKVNLKDAAHQVERLFVYEKIGKLNGHTLSVVNVENRTLDFHTHQDSDELFYVIQGGFHLETQDGLIRLEEGELIIVPKGVLHRPVVKGLTRFLMIELDGTLNKENSGDGYEE
jgi:mannose-6-phosphate isomerase-like protein (cupin superfamily)